ncbi:MAG: aminotransferase class V-fold PLP-dependent enzyme [Spartobacteria bacterium]|nr:aminotransferase class V-fold PLP-dependent enzyme [Spartobacteria bacterium]
MKGADVFPVIATHNGEPFHYLDSAATTLKPACVSHAVMNYYQQNGASVHRGHYLLSETAEELFDSARSDVAAFVHAGTKEDVVFTSGTTGSINMLAAMCRSLLVHGDVICVSQMDHHSNLIPWHFLAEQTGASLAFIPITENGMLDIDAYAELLDTQPVRIVALPHQSNVLGTINPLSQLAAMAHEKNALMMVDAAQSVAHIPIDITLLQCDFLSFSAHKMYGPTGIGALCGTPAAWDKMKPVYGGGDMVTAFAEKAIEPAPRPACFEAGTPNIAGVIGFAAAVRFLSTGRQDMSALSLAMRNALSDLPFCELLPTANPEAGIISFEIEGVHPHDAAQTADEFGVMLRAGRLCAHPLLDALNKHAVCRVSLGLYNDEQDIPPLINALQEAVKVYKK